MTVNELGAICIGWSQNPETANKPDGKRLYAPPPNTPDAEGGNEWWMDDELSDIDIKGEPTDEQIVNVQRLVDRAILQAGITNLVISLPKDAGGGSWLPMLSIEFLTERRNAAIEALCPEQHRQWWEEYKSD